MSLSVLVAAYGIILVISALFAFMLWRVYREPIFKPLMATWVSAFITFMVQGVFNNLELSGFFAFAGNAVTCLFMFKIYSEVTGVKLHFKFYFATLIAGLLISALLFLCHFQFVLSSAPFCVACAICILSVALTSDVANSNGPLSLMFRAIMGLNAIHFLDYPVLRSREDLAMIGFTIALCFLFSYATFVPLFILKNLADRFVSQLSEANNKQLIANNKLIITNEELTKVSAENRALMNVLVHDLATPINTLTVASRKLKEGGMTADSSRYLERIELAATGAYKTIMHVRDYHLSKSSGTANQLMDVRVRDVVHALLKEYNDHIVNKGLDVKILFNCDDSVSVLALADQLRQQVLANLLSNAIKFSHQQGEIKISIFQNDKLVTIQIQDFGVGVPDSKIPQLFSSVQGESTFGTKGERGTGLGLPIVHHYAKLMGGDVKYVQVDGLQSGSCFEVTLQSA
jgi:signal transduction histidine kinase